MQLPSKACKVQAARDLDAFAYPMLEQPSEHQVRCAMHKQTQCATSVTCALLQTLHSLPRNELTYRLSFH